MAAAPHLVPLLLVAALLACSAAVGGALSAAAAALPGPPENCYTQTRRDIKWGAATAAYQIEGAWNVSRSPSIWDVFAHTPGNIKGGATGDVACDHYHRYKEDFKLMRELGVKHYRFSISWPRILLDGGRKSALNPRAVAFYNSLLNEMEANGIEPAATMFHWDLPQVLHDRYKGPLSPEFAEDFEAYADALFRAFPRIKNWMTFNEPYVTCHFGYGVGSFAPGYKGGDVANMACVRNVLLAHGRAKRLSRTRYSRLGHRIGIALNIEWAEPFTQSSEDKAAAQRAIDLQFGAYADPLFLGRFPPLLKSKFGPAVKDFTPEEAALVKGSLDFLGINHYTANYVHANGDPLGFTYSPKSKDGVFIGPVAQSSWLRVYPDGIYKSVLYASKRYGWPEIWLTENGVSVPGEADMPVGQAVQDAFRVNYYRDYLNKLCRAKRDGVRVARYYAWSLLDNFEWVQGYTERFGITHVDFNTQKRTVKDSGRYLSEHFFKANS